MSSQAKLFCDGLGSGWSYIVKSLLRRKPKTDGQTKLLFRSNYRHVKIKGRSFDTINFTDLAVQLEQMCLDSNNLVQVTKVY